MEGRDVAAIDIPGAFMQADMDKLVHMRLKGRMAELLMRIDPKLYRKHVHMENGKAYMIKDSNIYQDNLYCPRKRTRHINIDISS
jgi:hypothetical protein